MTTSDLYLQVQVGVASTTNRAFLFLDGRDYLVESVCCGLVGGYAVGPPWPDGPIDFQWMGASSKARLQTEAGRQLPKYVVAGLADAPAANFRDEVHRPYIRNVLPLMT